MELNELIYTRLAKDKKITSLLAKYADGPAIFNSEFPSDQSDGWRDMEQYPRITYRYDTKADPKRASSGTLHVAVFAHGDMLITEKIEKAVVNRFRNVVMKSEEEAPFSVSWARSDLFEVEGTGIVYKDIAFDILEFPDQITASPDPVYAMNEFLHGLDGSLFLIGYDEIGDVYEPTDENPAIYVRAGALKKMQETYALVFVNVDLFIHVIAPDADYRLRWVRKLYDYLFRHGEIKYWEGQEVHPMLLEDIAANNTADYLREGQLRVRGMYTMLSHRVTRSYYPSTPGPGQSDPAPAGLYRIEDPAVPLNRVIYNDTFEVGGEGNG